MAHLKFNSGVQGLGESDYTKCKGETESGGKLYALLYKAYDLHMKIKRGRQILSTTQKTQTL